MLSQSENIVSSRKYKSNASLLKENPEEGSALNSTGEQVQFTDFMRRALGGEQKSTVNEEELFAALIETKLNEQNPEAASFFRERKAALSEELKRPDGYVSIEDVAGRALKETVAAGKIDKEHANEINDVAFRGAQLDDNLSALYDSRGSENDPTIATAAIDAALLRAQTALEQIDSGELEVKGQDLNESSDSASTSSGAQSLDGSGGFLWKPVSESDGKLVVLLPTNIPKETIEKVEIHDELPADESNKVAEGRFAGDTHNGGRAHFRFDRPGEAYGNNLHLVVFKNDGSSVHWDIANPGERND